MKNAATYILLSIVVVLLLFLGGYPEQTRRIARAIARAEGWYVSGSLAQINLNPGNLTKTNGNFHVFASESDGWKALYEYVERMLSGSGLYPSGSTIWEASRIYTATEQDYWAANVAADLGVSVNTRLEDV